MQGMFEICSKCVGNKNCCTDFEDIDNPIISSNEKKLIKRATNCGEEMFSKIECGCYNINTINGACPFYKNGCVIYDIRPNDCKLYPYDIKLIDGKYCLVRYKLRCLNNCVINENVDELIEGVKSYIQTYVNKKYNQKMDLFDYEIIKEIEG